MLTPVLARNTIVDGDSGGGDVGAAGVTILEDKVALDVRVVAG